MKEPDRAGQLLAGKFRVDRLLGSGGMGAVYVAEHVHLGKRVAVKFLHSEYATSEDAVRRFSQEARAAAAIGHRGIVDVQDVGTTDDGAPYIVMELLEGESLRDASERVPRMPLDRAVWVLLRLLSALGAAHAKGIVHRDLKPDNVFLEGPAGRPVEVKLLDFGISKMTLEADRSVTATGIALGTADYMAPEQARGRRDVDERADLWAAGVILYRLVTGRMPFGDESDNYNAVLARILTQPVEPPRALRPDLPADLEEAILRALSKEREGRFASAADFARAIAPHAGALGGWDDDDARVVTSPQALGSAPTLQAAGASARTAADMALDAPRPPPASAGPVTSAPIPALAPRGRGPWAVALVVAVVLGGIAAWALVPAPRDASREPTPRGAPAPRRDAPEVAAPPPATPPRVTIELVGAPDGARVVFDGAEVAGTSIRIAPRDVMVPLRVECDGYEAFALMVTPDHDQRVEVTMAEASRPRTRPGGAGGAATHKRGTPILTDTREFERHR